MIRTASPDDRERLREIQATLREPNPALLTYGLDGPPLALVSTARRERSEGRAGEAGERGPATADGDEPVGYLLAFYDEETAYVAELAVAPGFRREGRATRLLLAAFDRLRDAGCSRVTLTVHPKNDAGRRLYESLGFDVERRESEYYDDGSDAIAMALAL